MKCKVCGGSLKLENGIYVCENCHNKFEIASFYENAEVVIAYIESDEFGRRSKDSVVAQDIYNKLSVANINTFYQRISASDLSDDDFDKAYNIAQNSAKVIILLAGSKENFEKIILENSGLFSGKKVLPVYFDINAYDLPRELSAYQALNYNNVGSVTDLSKNILTILGRESEVNVFEVKDKKAAKRKRIITITTLSLLLVTIVSALYIVFGTTLVLPSKKYSKAEKLISNQQYADAIQILCKIEDYKNSKDLLQNAYGQYIGYYQNAEGNVGLHINISNGLRADIEITETLLDSSIVKIIESSQVEENVIKFGFNDSQNNQGDVTLELRNDGINLIKTLDNSNNNSVDTFFVLTEKSDQPILKELNAEVLLEWLEKKISMTQIEAQGYEVVEHSQLERDGLNRLYNIKNTDVILALFGLDISKPYDGYENMEELNDKILFGCIAPAKAVIPEYIGKPYEPFVKNNVLYWPGANLGESGGERNLSIDVYEDTGETVISEDTPIAFATKKTLREFNWESLLMNVFRMKVEKQAKVKYNLIADAWCYGEYEAENDTHQLYSIGTDSLNDNMSYALFKINKTTQAVEFITEAPKITSDWGGLEKVDWEMLYPELAIEFPINRYNVEYSN